MRDFMKFRDDAVHTVTDVFSSMTIDIREKDLYASSEFLSVSAEILDLFVVMDAMKNIKGSMNNDLSMYKR